MKRNLNLFCAVRANLTKPILCGSLLANRKPQSRLTPLTCGCLALPQCLASLRLAAPLQVSSTKVCFSFREVLECCRALDRGRHTVLPNYFCVIEETPNAIILFRSLMSSVGDSRTSVVRRVIRTNYRSWLTICRSCMRATASDWETSTLATTAAATAARAAAVINSLDDRSRPFATRRVGFPLHGIEFHSE